MLRIIVAICLVAVAGCGLVVPGTPGHEPWDGSTNPLTGTRGSGR